MNKEKLMAVAEKMEELAECIKALCSEAEEKSNKVEKAAEPEKKKEKATEPTPAKDEKKYAMEDVRKALAAKSTAGFTAEVRELLKKHGATKLSAIAESEYAAIMREVEEIG